MRFIHIADIHASRERLNSTLHILDSLKKRALKGDVDFILFAGDFWDSTITATKGSGFSDIVSAIRELEKHTKLFFIYGTASHEPNGSLDAFASSDTKIISSMSKCKLSDCELVFIPEPRRSNYVKESIQKTDTAINKDISSFLSSLEETDFTRVLVYHGEVKGACYQNGITASSSIAVSEEQLQSVNAQYYALGHIHEPQEVFSNAWYSGSACPKDFGETHTGAYNLVTIENKKTSVERCFFNLPTFKTLNFTESKESIDSIIKGLKDYSNCNLRIQFNCTKEERKLLNIKQLQEEIKEKTNAVSVKLEPSVIEGEVIQKSEVSKRKSIVEKMFEYAKEKNLKLPKYSKKLLQDIQDNSLLKLSFPQHSFELLYLSLRGAIGIKNGQHKEDYELNFENFEDGVVCLCGACGSGKTSLQENCHPYPCMLTRDGSLKDHFYLKDSHRILVYKDENGIFYKISMLIDGKTQTGKTSYFVETSKDRENWKSLSEVDGSLKSYEDWVNSTFGTIDVFLRTAFFAKEQTKNASDISATTKSERMELLSKLAGTEHLKGVAQVAKEERKELEKKSELLEVELSSYSRYEEAIKQNESDITRYKKDLENQKLILSLLEKEVEELKAKDFECQKVKAIKEVNTVLHNQYKKELSDKQTVYSEYLECIENKDIFDKVKKCYKKAYDNLPHIEKNKGVLFIQKENYEELSDTVEDLMIEIQKLRCDLRVLDSQIVEINEICPTCGQPLSEHKKKELYDTVRENQKRKESLSSEIDSKIKKVNKIDRTSELKKEIEATEKLIQKLSDERQECLSFYQNTKQIYKDFSYEQICQKADVLKEEISSLQAKIESFNNEADIEDVSEKLKEKAESLNREKNRFSDIEASIRSTEKENERYKKELETVADKKKEIKDFNDKVEAYLFIEEAFSNNGIPAIELRESAPEIADIANRILKDSYGNKFEIRFGSTSELKAKRKSNEDFNILVYDSENGDEKTIDLVSSGERIWIKQALFYAFSIIQMNRTGFNFRTRLIDESDGSLDGSLRPKYLKMVESAHKVSNSRLTMLITHSQEIKDIASQTIEM